MHLSINYCISFSHTSIQINNLEKDRLMMAFLFILVGRTPRASFISQLHGTQRYYFINWGMGGQVGGLVFTSNFLQFCSKLFTDAFPRVRKNELKQIALKALLFQLITDVDDLWRIFLFFFFFFISTLRKGLIQIPIFIAAFKKFKEKGKSSLRISFPFHSQLFLVRHVHHFHELDCSIVPTTISSPCFLKIGTPSASGHGNDCIHICLG